MLRATILRPLQRLACLLTGTAALGGGLGACASRSELDLSLRLSDAVYVASASARITISTASEPGFAAAPTPIQIARGLFVSNRDVDGDGRIDIVLETGADFDLKPLTHFSLRPEGIVTPLNVTIRAETFDRDHARVARLGGAARDLSSERVSALLSPLSRTSAAELAPACVGTCPEPTARYGQGDVGQILALDGAPPSALLAGAFESRSRAQLVIGAADAATPAVADRVAQPRAGRVELWGGSGGALSRHAAIAGPHAGDRLGASLAKADLDGDGQLDLLVGAPGSDGGRGALWVLYGPLDDTSGLDGPTVAKIAGADGAQLGAALSVEDLDGDGLLDVLVGAPGADSVHVLRTADLARGQRGILAAATTIKGEAGTHFGATLDARRGALAVGAPLEAMGAAYFVPTTSPLPPGAHAPAELGATRWLGAGGGFGSSVVFADTSGDGALALVVGAPLDGGGRILMRRVAALLPGTAEAETGVSSLRGFLDSGGLGATLALARGGLGDRLLFGAAGSATRPGAAYALSATTAFFALSRALDQGGGPAEILIAGGDAHDGFGSVQVAGDFNHDGALDLAIGARVGTVSIMMGPLL